MEQLKRSLIAGAAALAVAIVLGDAERVEAPLAALTEVDRSAE